MASDPYESFAEIYDQWQKLYPRPFSLALAPRVRKSVQVHGSPNQVIADTACGTGIFAHWWHRTHPKWTVYGTDRSAAMIRVAQSPQRRATASAGKRPAPARRNMPRFLVQDLKRLELPEPAGVITCLFDSLNHVTRQWDLLRVFKRIHAQLAPGGIFIFDLVDEIEFPDVFTGTSILQDKDLYLGMETWYGHERGIGIGEARFTFFRRTGPTWKRIVFNIRERRWFRAEIRDLLAGANLELVRLERIDPYESKHFVVPRTYWVCRRTR